MTPILITAGIMLTVGLLTILAWFLYTFYLDRAERRLAGRKGLYRELVSELAGRDRALLEPAIHQRKVLATMINLTVVKMSRYSILEYGDVFITPVSNSRQVFT